MLDGEHFQAGIAMATGLFRVAFLVMLERTLTQFMKNVFQAEILRHAALDKCDQAARVLLWPAPASCRRRWRPGCRCCWRCCWPGLSSGSRARLRRLDLGIMYLGYAAIVLQLLLEFLGRMAQAVWVGAVSTHVFGLGVMGLIIPAMLIRIAKGHTGRKVVFEAIDKAVLWLMIGAFLLRVAAPQVLPQHYALWLVLAACGWLIGFGILAWRLVPFLLQARIDGKEH
jgi:uncharacterized protein involved in response to NO